MAQPVPEDQFDRSMAQKRGHTRTRISRDPAPSDFDELYFPEVCIESEPAKPRKRKRQREKLNQVNKNGSQADDLLHESFEMPLLPPEVDDAAVNTTAWERSGELKIMADNNATQASSSAVPDAAGTVVLDPEHSERQYYRSPLTGFQREIWRPGDKDGVIGTEYFERAGPVLPLDQRWRLFQSDIGPIGLGQHKKLPPRFVFLDDRAAYELVHSDIQRARLNQDWPHDFGNGGKIRPRRVHCGRPAIKDSDGPDYHSVDINPKKKYYFTGEKDYKPIIYRVPPPQPRPPTVEELIRKRKAEDAADPLMYNPRGHGHNQHTPKDMMVKFGAPTFSRKKSKDEGSEISAARKRIPPKKIPPKHASRYGGSRAESEASARNRPKTLASEVSVESPTPAAVEPPQDSAEESNSDVELFPKRNASTIASSIGVPRQLGYIDRRRHEEALAEETMNTVQNQDDVMRIASELAEANGALSDQGREIARLKKALEETQAEVKGMQEVVEAQERVIEQMQGEAQSGA